MEQVTTTQFTALNQTELENTFGGKTIYVAYFENGVLKWKEVTIN